MTLRLLGFVLLVAISVPLVIAFPPLALVAVGGAVLWLNRRRSSGSSGRRRSGRGRTSAPRQRRGPTRGQRARASSSRRGSGFGTGVRWLVVGIGVVLLAGTLVNQAPDALTGQATALRNVLILLAAGSIVLLVWRRVFRTPGKRQAPMFATVPGPSRAVSTAQTGTEFEWQVADLLTELDFRRVQHVGGPGDGGVDIIAEDNQGRTFLVQCKRFAPGKKVGSVDVQKLIGAVVHQDADGGIFVTTASFTSAAVNLAASGRVPIELIDGQGLTRLSRAVA